MVNGRLPILSAALPTQTHSRSVATAGMARYSPHARDARLNTTNPAMTIFLIAPLSHSFPNIRTSPARTRK